MNLLKLETLTAFLATAAFKGAAYETVIVDNVKYEIVQYWGHDDKDAVIVGFADGYTPSGHLTFPTSIDVNGEKINVTQIGWGNHSGHEADTPAIGNNPFITSVTLPKYMDYIGKFEFIGCPNISSFAVEEGNTDLKAIDNALYENRGYDDDVRWYLRRYPSTASSPTFAVPAETEGIMMGAFADNTYLKKIYLSGKQFLLTGWQLGNRSIECADCTANENYYTIDDGFAIIYGNSFDGVCPGKALDSYTIPDRYRYLDSGAFCNSQVKHVTIPASMTDYANSYTFAFSDIETLTLECEPTHDLGVACFMNAKKLKNLEMAPNSNGKLDISYCALFGCDNLQTITFADGVKTIKIGYSAFEGCKALTGLPLTSKMKIGEIGSRSFYGCESMESFLFGTIQEFNGDYQFAASGLKTMHWPSAITNIPTGCFAGCKNLTKINLKETTAQIGIQSFMGTGLTEFSMAGVEWFYYDSFDDCPDLRRVYFPANTRQRVRYNPIPMRPANSAIIVNHPNVDGLASQSRIKSDNISLYISGLDYPEPIGDGWQRVCVPGRASNYYENATSAPVAEMFSYKTFWNDKAVEIEPLLPGVAIGAVCIEGVEATRDGNRWTAADASLQQGIMNVDVSYTVSGGAMNTSYQYLYENSGIDQVENGRSPLSITVASGARIIFSTEADWAVYGLSGVKMLSGRGTQADISTLGKGAYVIRANAGMETKTRRIIL